MNRSLIVFIFTLIFFLPAISYSAQPIKIYQVSEGIYRGPRPALTDLQHLQQMGIRTVINLDNVTSVFKWEKEQVENLGMTFINHPLSGFWAPKKSVMEQVLKELDDPNLYPIYLHCKHGQDRTGLAIGLYRVFYQGWTPAKSYSEMRYYGFHPILFPLKMFFRRMTSGIHVQQGILEENEVLE
ncbi:MAG: tyrosine-protein phosphatase [Pseudomonadota bacterium]